MKAFILASLLLLIPLINAIDVNNNGVEFILNGNVGTFTINNGLNCGGLQCSNCNGSKYDVAFSDAAGNEQIEIDFGFTQVSSNGPNCSAGSVLTVTRTTPSSNVPPAKYVFADPGVSWTASVVIPGTTALVACTYTNPDPNELGVVVSPLGCYKYEWIYTHQYPTMTLAQAQATLRWGTRINGVWTVNDNVNVGQNTYLAAENKILISVPALGEYAVFRFVGSAFTMAPVALLTVLATVAVFLF